MQKLPIIQHLFAILKTAPTKEEAIRQMNALFDQDEALAKTLVTALLIHALERNEVYPLLGVEPLDMVDLQILAYFSTATWHGMAAGVVRDRLAQQEQQG